MDRDYKLNESEYNVVGENSPMLFNKKIWRVKDVAKFLDCSIGHIYNLTADEKIPKIKKGKFVYFVPDDILNWVLTGDEL